MLDLVATEELQQELMKRVDAGVIVLMRGDTVRYVWKGEQVACLGLLAVADNEIAKGRRAAPQEAF